MENNTNNTSTNKGGFFSLLYRTRIMITKGETTIVNLSLLFCIISLLFAPWLVVIGAIIALVLGYKFAIDRNAKGFDKDFEHIVKDAAHNVKQVVENVTDSNETKDHQSGDSQM